VGLEQPVNEHQAQRQQKKFQSPPEAEFKTALVCRNALRPSSGEDHGSRA
jgi:hypothetical protein